MNRVGDKEGERVRAGNELKHLPPSLDDEIDVKAEDEGERDEVRVGEAIVGNDLKLPVRWQ